MIRKEKGGNRNNASRGRGTRPTRYFACNATQGGNRAIKPFRQSAEKSLGATTARIRRLHCGISRL
jgi:hypothetical protein